MAAQDATDNHWLSDAQNVAPNIKPRSQDVATIATGGDFQVLVHIIEGRDIKSKDNGDASDPRVTVTIFDEEQSTAIQYNTKSPEWDQVLCFQLNNLQPDELSRGNALIEVFDVDIISSNDLIGAFACDLSRIYFRPHHEMYNHWIRLTNTEEITQDEKASDGIEGYLKLSITVLGRNDTKHNHDEAQTFITNTQPLKPEMIALPPLQTRHLLTIRIYEARHLAKTDEDTLLDEIMNSTGSNNLNPFFYVEYAGVRLPSKHYIGVSPTCNVEFQIPIMEPVFSHNIRIIIMDYDQLSSDDRIGCLAIDYYQLKKENEMRMGPCWHYIYGAPLGYYSAYARKMNDSLVEGSTFRGMVCMEARVESKASDMISKKQVIENIKGLSPQERPKMIEYYLRCDLYEGAEMNKIQGLKHHMFVMVSITHNTGRSQERRIHNTNSCVEWYECLVSPHNPDKCIGPFLLPERWYMHNPPAAVVLPDVFIYLCVKDIFVDSGDIEQVSYCRVALNTIIKPGMKRTWDNGPIWYDMKKNLAIDKYANDVFPGALLIGLNAGPKADISKDEHLKKTVSRRFSHTPSVSRPFSHPYMFKAVPTDDTPRGKAESDDDAYNGTQIIRTQSEVHVTVHCLEASQLVGMDRNNSSDPYVEVTMEDDQGNKRKKEISKIKEDLNPKWNRAVEFDHVKVGHVIHLRVLDWDFGFGADSEIAHIESRILTGNDFEGWVPLKPSTQVSIKYRMKPYLLKNMKIKIAVKYEWEEQHSSPHDGLFGRSPTVRPFAKLSKPQRRPMLLRVHCYRLRNLVATPSTHDGHLVVRFCGRSKRIKIIEDDMVVLGVDVPVPLRYAPRIYCEVYDADDMQTSLGRFRINPDEIWKVFSDEGDMDGPQLRWYSLQDAEQREVRGEIFCAFELMDVRQCISIQMSVTQPWWQMVEEWLSYFKYCTFSCALFSLCVVLFPLCVLVSVPLVLSILVVLPFALAIVFVLCVHSIFNNGCPEDMYGLLGKVLSKMKQLLKMSIVYFIHKH